MEAARVISHETEDGKIYNVIFEDGNKEVFSDEEFFEHGLYDVDAPLPVSFSELMTKVYEKRAYMRAVSFLRGTLKPEKIVSEKLKDEGFSPDIIYCVMERLREELYVDDRRFCKKHVQKRLDAGNSKLYIKAELREKGIEEHLVEECLREADADDQVQAEKLVLKKLKVGSSPEKIKRYLSGKGFSVSTILAVFDSIELSTENDVENSEY